MSDSSDNHSGLRVREYLRPFWESQGMSESAWATSIKFRANTLHSWRKKRPTTAQLAKLAAHMQEEGYDMDLARLVTAAEGVPPKTPPDGPGVIAEKRAELKQREQPPQENGGANGKSKRRQRSA